MNHVFRAKKNEYTEVDGPDIEVIGVVVIDELPNLHVVLLGPEPIVRQWSEKSELITENKNLKYDKGRNCHKIVECVIIYQVWEISFPRCTVKQTFENLGGQHRVCF